MTEPLRLSDDTDPALSMLLRAGQQEVPPRNALQKTLAGLGAATTVVGASHVAGAAVTVGKLGVWSLAKWAGAGVLSGVIAIGGVELVQRGIESSPERTAKDTSALTPVTKSQPRSADPLHGAPSLALPAPESERVPMARFDSQASADRGPLAVNAERPHASSAKPNGPSPGAVSPADVDSTISLELGLVDEARRALQAGRPGAALEALRRHRSEVQRPRLSPEAQYLEMEALNLAGNTSAAQAAARALLARFPRGPHAGRAQSILEGRHGAP